MCLRSAPARASMHGRSAAPMHVKCIGDNTASPSRPDQHLVSLLIKILLLRSHPVLTDGIAFHTRMAHPSPTRLWASALKGVRTRRCATGPRDRDGALGQRRVPKPRSAGECAIRAAFSFVHFFWPNKRNGPRVQGRSHPPLAFEIACKAREIFKTWISAFAEMTTMLQAAEHPAFTLMSPKATPNKSHS